MFYIYKNLIIKKSNLLHGKLPLKAKFLYEKASSLAADFFMLQPTLTPVIQLFPQLPTTYAKKMYLDLFTQI